MILASAPLRVSLVGGGSDLPEFFDEEPGGVVSATLSLRMHVCLAHRAVGGVRLAYSRVEEVDRAEDLQHDLARHALARHGMVDHLEIVSLSEAPSNAGLGSSAAFTVALLAALDKQWYTHRYKTKEDLIYEAIKIELEDCGHRVGLQDQYACAVGGLNHFRFVHGAYVAQTVIGTLTQQTLSDRLLLFYTGRTHSAPAQLAQLDLSDSRNRASIRAGANLADMMLKDLFAGNISQVGNYLNAAWAVKRGLPGVTDEHLDSIHSALTVVGGKDCGAKLLGAGGGGCFLVYANREHHQAIRAAAKGLTLTELPCNLASGGVETAQLW